MHPFQAEHRRDICATLSLLYRAQLMSRRVGQVGQDDNALFEIIVDLGCIRLDLLLQLAQVADSESFEVLKQQPRQKPHPKRDVIIAILLELMPWQQRP